MSEQVDQDNEDPKIKHLRYIVEEMTTTATMDRMIASFTDDIVYRVTVGPGTPMSGVPKGKAEVLPYLEVMMKTLEIVEFNPKEYFSSPGNQAVLTGAETLRIPINGEVFTVDWAAVFTFVDDDPTKIREILIIENLEPLSRAYAAQSAD